MANQRNLKAFVRFDGSGRIVAGSLILRKQKPKVGRWQEIPAYECCEYVPTPTILTDTIPGGGFPIYLVSVRLFCDESPATARYTNYDADNMTELIDYLNSESTSQFGTYEALDEVTVQLTVPPSVKEEYCPYGTLSFNIFED